MKVRTDIWLVLFFSLLIFWQVSKIYQWQITKLLVSETFLYSDAAWCFELLLNLFGYGLVWCTIYGMYLYFLVMDDFNRNADTASYLFFVLFGWIPDECNVGERDAGFIQHWPITTRPQQRFKLISYLSGLFVSYLVQGLILEKIMTKVYRMPDNSYEGFYDSQFLAYITCTAGGFASLTQLYLSNTQIITRALFKYYKLCIVYIVSIWCQYEVLKFVCFPTVVLFTSFQILRRDQRTLREQWLTATFLSTGFLLYLFNSSVKSISLVVALSGATLLLLHVLCDSYISTWQRKMLEQNEITTPVQMMFALNFLSCIMTGGAFLQYPKTNEAIAVFKHPVFAVDCALLMGSLSVGQLLLYSIIDKFGAQVFTIIMVLRQMVSILLSCAVYGHWITWRGCAGVIIMFIAIVSQINKEQKRKYYNKHIWI